MTSPYQIHAEFKSRNPLRAWGLVFLTLGVYYFVWYYKINREAKEFLSDDTIKPGLSLLAVTLGSLILVPSLISVYRTGARIQRMQEQAKTTSPISPALCLLASLFLSLNVPYMQENLNAVWRAEGLPVPAPVHLKDFANGRVLPWTLVVLLLGAALAGWLTGGGSDSGRVAQVKQTATQFLMALTNFSASTIDQDVGRIRSYAVGSFAQQVDQTFSAARIQQIKQAKVVSKATVKSVFVEDLTGDQATVFGVVAETVTNNIQAAPRSDVIRAELTMLDTKDGWKVEQVNIFQAPGATG